MTRTKIALRNLYISQAIIIVFLVFAYLVWFPHSFSELGGFYKTAWMLVFVDLILGPLLVLIVYKKDKKYLAFDINVLLAIQLGAFVFGAYSLYLKHPAYAVFTGDRFTLTNVSRVYPQQSWDEQLKTSFFSSPRLVVAKAPDDVKERNALLFDVLLKGAPDIDERPEYYEPFETHSEAILAKDINPDTLFFNKERQTKLKTFIVQYGGTRENYAFFPLRGNNQKDVVWVLDRENAKPVGIIDIDPWVLVKKS